MVKMVIEKADCWQCDVKEYWLHNKRYRICKVCRYGEPKPPEGMVWKVRLFRFGYGKPEDDVFLDSMVEAYELYYDYKRGWAESASEPVLVPIPPQQEQGGSDV